jgi:hypothetical protein
MAGVTRSWNARRQQAILSGFNDSVAPTCRHVLDDAPAIVAEVDVDESITALFAVNPAAASIEGLRAAPTAAAAGLAADESAYVRRVRLAVESLRAAQKRFTPTGSNTAVNFVNSSAPPKLLLRFSANDTVHANVEESWRRLLQMRTDAGLPVQLRHDSVYTMAAASNAAGMLAAMADAHLYLCDAAGSPSSDPLRRYKRPGVPGAESWRMGFAVEGPVTPAAIAKVPFKVRLTKSGQQIGLPPYRMRLAIPSAALRLRRQLAQEASARVSIEAAWYALLVEGLAVSARLQRQYLESREALALTWARSRHAIHEREVCDVKVAHQATLLRQQAEARAAISAHHATSTTELWGNGREQLEFFALVFRARDQCTHLEAAVREARWAEFAKGRWQMTTVESMNTAWATLTATVRSEYALAERKVTNAFAEAVAFTSTPHVR